MLIFNGKSYRDEPVTCGLAVSYKYPVIQKLITSLLRISVKNRRQLTLGRFFYQLNLM